MMSRSQSRASQAIVWQAHSAFQLVHEIVRKQQRHLATVGIRVQLDIPRWITLISDLDALRQAIRDLIGCAVAAMPDGGELSITAWPRGEALELEVADSRAESVPRQRWETTCNCVPESVRRAAAIHGGELTVANCPEGGLAVTLSLPLHMARAAA